MPWEILLAIVGTSWVFPFSVARPSFFGKVLRWERNARKCERQHLFAFFGQYGVKEIGWLLIMMHSQLTKTFSFVIYGLGPMCTVGIETGIYWIFQLG